MKNSASNIVTLRDDSGKIYFQKGLTANKKIAEILQNRIWSDLLQVVLIYQKWLIYSEDVPWSTHFSRQLGIYLGNIDHCSSSVFYLVQTTLMFSL